MRIGEHKQVNTAIKKKDSSLPGKVIDHLLFKSCIMCISSFVFHAEGEYKCPIYNHLAA